MKKLIFTLSLLFSLCVSFSAFAADYTISDAFWEVGDKAYASWDEPEDNTKYKVQLFKGSKRLSSAITTSSERYDFTKLILENGAGTYTFTVYPTKGGDSLKVTSAGEYFDSETISHLRKVKNGSTGSSTSATAWYQSNNVWHYRKSDGYNATNWNLIDNVWYYFDANANMLTGWIESNGYRYYMTPSGAMATGWTLIDNKWYFFDESGHFKTGWIESNGLWYYLSPNGDMATNTTIDGYNINADGVWVQ